MSHTQDYYDKAGVAAGSSGFGIAVALTFIGAFGKHDPAMIAGAIVAALTAITVTALELISHKEVTHAHTETVVDTTLPTHP